MSIKSTSHKPAKPREREKEEREYRIFFFGERGVGEGERREERRGSGHCEIEAWIL